MESKKETSIKNLTENVSVQSTKSFLDFDTKVLISRIKLAQELERSMDKIVKNFNDFFSQKEIMMIYARDKKSMYSIERSNKGQKVFIEGLGISFVKDLANLYGHLDYGIQSSSVLYEGQKKARAVAYCIDLCKNVNVHKPFRVHFPDYFLKMKKGAFDNESYIYIYSHAGKRIRACIEQIIPRWILATAEKKLIKLKNEYVDSIKSEKEIEELYKEIFLDAKSLKKEIKNDEDLSKFLGFNFSFDLIRKDKSLIIKAQKLLEGLSSEKEGVKNDFLEVEEKKNIESHLDL